MADTEFIPLRQWVRYWEERSVEPRCHSARVQRLERLINLCAEAAPHIGMNIPEIRLVDLRKSSRVDYRHHVIYLGFGDRWELPLLHHLALLASKNDLEPYGAGFMATAIALYSKFLKIDEQLLRAGAEHFELEFTPPTAGAARP